MDILDQSTIPPGTDDDGPEESRNGDGPDYTDFRLILEAPDFATFVKRPRNARVREYEKRTASALKLVALGAMQSDNFADAATVLWFGPSVATAAGHIADTNDQARKVLDMLTAPNSPWVALAMTVWPLMAQLARNHEEELEKLPSKLNVSRKARQARAEARKAQATKTAPRWTLRLGRWRIPVRFQWKPWKLLTAGIRAQTVDPLVVTSRVFTDDALLAELRRMGYNIQPVQRHG